MSMRLKISLMQLSPVMSLQLHECRNVDSLPASDIFLIIKSQKRPENQKLFHSMMVSFVREYINITPFQSAGTVSETTKDGVTKYAVEVLSLGATIMEFNGEGDGERLIRSWKFLFLMFRALFRGFLIFWNIFFGHLILRSEIANRIFET